MLLQCVFIESEDLLCHTVAMLSHETEQRFLLLAPAGRLRGADLYDELRPGPAAGTAAEAGKEVPARLRHLPL